MSSFLDKSTSTHSVFLSSFVKAIFKKNQIEEISALGEKLDPNKHQAMLEVEDEDKEQGIIVQEIQKGFTLIKPCCISSHNFGRLAQLVEHLVYTEGVKGSSPLLPTKNGGVAQLVRAIACHAIGRGFESRHSRHFYDNCYQ